MRKWKVQTAMKNPFKYGKEVSGYQFYDRDEDIRKLCRKMADGSSNVVLFAPRRYGKTSLVLKALDRLSVKEGIKSFCFDMTKAQSLAGFCEEYANAVYASFGGRQGMVHRIIGFLADCNASAVLKVGGAVSIKLDFAQGMTVKSITEVLDLPEKLAHDAGDIPFVVAFDEFQEVAELSREFTLEKIFRSVIQTHRNVRYVFFGSKPHLMKRMFGEASRPFYKSAYAMPLGKPPESDSVEFLTSRFRDCAILLDEATARELVLRSDNVPYYLQELASEVFERVTDEGRESVALEDIENAAEEITGKNTELYEARVALLSDAQLALLHALAREKTAVFDDAYRTRHGLPVSSTLHTALQALMNGGIVVNDSSGYRLADPFFGAYLNSSPVHLFTARS